MGRVTRQNPIASHACRPCSGRSMSASRGSLWWPSTPSTLPMQWASVRPLPGMEVPEEGLPFLWHQQNRSLPQRSFPRRESHQPDDAGANPADPTILPASFTSVPQPVIATSRAPWFRILQRRPHCIRSHSAGRSNYKMTTVSIFAWHPFELWIQMNI